MLEGGKAGYRRLRRVVEESWGKRVPDTWWTAAVKFFEEKYDYELCSEQAAEELLFYLDVASCFAEHADLEARRGMKRGPYRKCVEHRGALLLFVLKCEADHRLLHWDGRGRFPEHGRIPWKHVLPAWNERHPERQYRTIRAMQRAYDRAREAVGGEWVAELRRRLNGEPAGGRRLAFTLRRWQREMERATSPLRSRMEAFSSQAERIGREISRRMEPLLRGMEALSRLAPAGLSTNPETGEAGSGPAHGRSTPLPDPPPPGLRGGGHPVDR